MKTKNDGGRSPPRRSSALFSRIANGLTYAVFFMLCVVFTREAYTYVRFDVIGYTVSVAPPEKPEKVQAQPKSLKLLTYNVLVHQRALDQRMPVLFRILEDSQADIIALQEVGSWFMPLLAKEAWAKKYYWIDTVPGDCVGQFILSKFPPEKAICYGLPGHQSRRALIAAVNVGGRRLTVATSHMESPLEAGAVRGRQLDVMFGKMKGADDFVMMSDFNFGDNAPEEKNIPPGYVDMWKELRPGEPGFTWDNEKSDMAGKSAERFVDEPSRRLDKILVSSSFWKPKEVGIVGDKPVVKGRKDLFPSDHFGVAGTLVAE